MSRFRLRSLVLPVLALVVAGSLVASPTQAVPGAPVEKVTWKVTDRRGDVVLNRPGDRRAHPRLARALDIRSARFTLDDRGLEAVVRVNRAVHRRQVTQMLLLSLTGPAAGARTQGLAVAAFVGGPVIGADAAGDTCSGTRFSTSRRPARLRLHIPAACLPDSVRRISVSNFAELRGADFGTDLLNTRVPS